MKREIKNRIGGFIALLVVMLYTAVCLQSCNQDRRLLTKAKAVLSDSMYIPEQIDAYMNPSFSSTAEVQIFKQKIMDDIHVEDMFYSIPEDVMVNVATVCLKKKPRITAKDIVAEYEANRTIYDNLPSQESSITELQAYPEDVPSKPDKIDEDLLKEKQKKAGTVSYRYEKDTVDGKPVKVLVREERTYDQ